MKYVKDFLNGQHVLCHFNFDKLVDIIPYPNEKSLDDDVKYEKYTLSEKSEFPKHFPNV